ncbi:MAG: hypothetical protein ACC652_12180 [Acidimicrobiales bacterium]
MNVSTNPDNSADSDTLLTTNTTTSSVDRRRREAPVEWQQFSATVLAGILDEAYAEEVAQRRESSFLPEQHERDAGTRFVTGLIVGVPLGLAIWGLIMGAIILLS